MKKFKNVERGWADDTGEVQVQKTAVDNVMTNWSIITPTGEELAEAMPDPFTADKVDYWYERLVVHYEPYAIPTALNTLEYVDLFVGLCVLTTNVAEKFEVPLGMTSQPFWNHFWRGQDGCSRILRARPHRTFLRGQAVNEDEVSVSDRRDPFYMFDVKNIFLRRNESLAVVVSQTGEQDDFSTWITSDIAGVAWMSQALIREKRK